MALQRVTAGRAAAVITLALSLAVVFEGNSPKAYMDRLPANPTPTACAGHTGPDVHVGATYSQAQCDTWARADMATANATVHRCILAPMKPFQEAALTDAVYNVGPAIVCGSTLQRYANAGQWSAACQQLTRWVYAGGKELLGLVRRRHAERDMCEGH